MNIYRWCVPISVGKTNLQEHERDALDQHIENMT